MLVVVDDSPALDAEIFNMEEFEGADWVLISDEAPVDENRRDELLERFQVHYHPGGAASITDDGDEDEDELEDDDQDGRTRSSARPRGAGRLALGAPPESGRAVGDHRGDDPDREATTTTTSEARAGRPCRGPRSAA